MSLFKFMVNKLKCNSSCSMNEEYCPDKCKEYFENISNMELNSKDLKKNIFNLTQITFSN